MMNQDSIKQPDGELSSEQKPTKKRILRAAAEIFASKGFAGTSTRDIAASAKVNVSTLHYHWESKEKLYIAVIEEVCQGLVEIGGRWEVRAAEADLENMEQQRVEVRNAVGELVEYALNSRIFARLMAQKWSLDRAPMDVETKILLPAAASISRALKNAFERGLGRSIDPDLLTLDFVWLLMGYLVGEPLFEKLIGNGLDEEATRARLKEHITELALRIIGLV